MRTIHETSQFRRDLKKLKKQRKDLEKLKELDGPGFQTTGRLK